jgi:hypothetical protein
LPSERMLVATIAAFTPLPTVGFRVARRGGHSTAQAPLHVLFASKSRLKR